MQWLQAACSLGHAFCGPAGGAGSLHRLVMQHGAASFQRMHTGNLETLHSLLERELWRSVPLPPSQSALLASPADWSCMSVLVGWRDYRSRLLSAASTCILYGSMLWRGR